MTNKNVSAPMEALGLGEMAPVNSQGRLASTATKWETAIEHVQGLLKLNDDWDGEGSPAIDQKVVRSALRLAKELIANKWDAPHDVYPLPDGGIVLEWQRSDGKIERFEIETSERARLITTYSDRPAEFFDWPLSEIAETSAPDL